MKFTLTELRYLDAVAREGHFSRAADACFVSQPTLSAGIRKLEEQLGLQIFERGRNGARITAAGERVLNQARRVLEEARLLEQTASGHTDPLVGPLRVGVIYSIGPYLLPKLIPALRRLAPQMPLILEENYTAQLRHKLEQGLLDVIIIATPFTASGGRVHPVYEEDFVVALPNGHRLSRQKRIATHDLDQENTLLLGAGHCFRDQVLQACPACQQGSEGDILEGSSLETICHMVASGIGVTVLPHSATAHHAANQLLTIRPMQAPAPHRQVALAWRQSFPRPEAVEALRQAVLRSGLDGVRFLKQAKAA